MRKIIALYMLTAFFASSCKKDIVRVINNLKPTVVLTKITHQGIDQVIFTYNGKQLSKFVLNGTETHVFNYDSNGQLTGTTITNRPTFNDVCSEITSTGGKISMIRFYKAGNVIERQVVFAYQTSDLVSVLDRRTVYTTLDDSVKYIFQYDSNHHRISEQSGSNIRTYSGFDTNHSFLDAVPNQEYFAIIFGSYSSNMYTDFPYAVNNPASAKIAPGGINYTYQFNSSGYPTTAAYQVFFDGEGNQNSDSWGFAYKTAY